MGGFQDDFKAKFTGLFNFHRIYPAAYPKASKGLKNTSIEP